MVRCKNKATQMNLKNKFIDKLCPKDIQLWRRIDSHQTILTIKGKKL